MAPLSTEIEYFIEGQLAAGKYPNRNELLEASVALLRQSEQVLARLDEGRRQLDVGEFTDYSAAALRDRFDELKRRGADRSNESLVDHP